MPQVAHHTLFSLCFNWLLSMKLSVIIPIYNVEQYLNRCLNSLAAQNNEHIEIVMVNDGSQDNGFQIAANYAEKYPNFYLLNQENKGLSGARNTGFANSSGEYLWFVDSDDYIEDGAIQKILETIYETNANIIATNVTIIRVRKKNETTSVVKRPFFESGNYDSWNFYKKAYVTPFSGAPFYILKRTFLVDNKISFKEGIYFEDLLFTPTILAFSENCYYLNYSPYFYYIREGSITTTVLSIKKCKDVLTVADSLYETFVKCTSKGGKKILKSSILRIISFYYPNYYCKVDKQDRKQSRDLYRSKKYFKTFIFKTTNPKYLISYLQIIIGWPYPFRKMIKKLLI